MAIQLQVRRGTATQHNTFTGASGELTLNTTNNSLHVHNGSTAGGFETAKANKQIVKTNFQSIRNLILEKKKKTDPAFLMYLIKAEKKAGFGDLIDLLDEMQICDIPVGHYAEVELTDAESLELSK